MYTYFPRLKERRRQQAGTLSGGEQQMLAVSRALMLRPRLLLAHDEPSFRPGPFGSAGGVRDRSRPSTSATINMLLVEQNASLALKLADHAYLMETGRVVISGTSESIRNDESVRRSYLGY